MGQSKADILARIRSKKKTLKLESIDLELTIKTLPSGKVLDIYDEYQKGNLNQQQLMFELISMSVVDENGNQLFNVDEIKEFDLMLLNELGEEVRIYNGISIDKENGATEELKNPV